MFAKKQIILVSAALGLVVILLVLPNGVVKKDPSRGKQPVAQATPKDTAEVQAHEDESMHQVDLSPDQQREVQKLKSVLAKKASAAGYEALGDFFINIQAFDSSVFYFEKALALENKLPIKIKISDSYYALVGITQGNNPNIVQKCTDLLREVIEEAPQNLEAKAKLGYLTTLTSNMPMEGVAMLNEVLAKDPDQKTALLNLGLLAITSGQYEKAIKRFEKLVALDKNDFRSWYYLALCHKESNNASKTKEIVDMVAKSNADPVLIGEAKKLLVK